MEAIDISTAAIARIIVIGYIFPVKSFHVPASSQI